MMTARHIDELSGYADPIAGLSHTALKNRFNVQFLPDILNPDIFFLERKSGRAGDHSEPFKLSHRVDDLAQLANGER